MSLANLTLASAKHLMTQGHITPAHHAKIVASVKMPHLGMKKPPIARTFGSLIPQQAQAPVPGVGSDPSSTPSGTASGY